MIAAAGLPCVHTLGENGLVCTRTDPHERGHVFISPASAPDAIKDEEVCW